MSGPAPTRSDRLAATAAGLTVLLAIVGFAFLPHDLAVEPLLNESSNARVAETLAEPAAPPATSLDLQPATEGNGPPAAGPCPGGCAPVRVPDTGDGGMR